MAYAVETSASGSCGGTLFVVTSMMLMLLLLLMLLMLVWVLVLLLLGWHQCSEEPCCGAASSLVLTRVWGVGATGWRHSGVRWRRSNGRNKLDITIGKALNPHLVPRCLCGLRCEG